MDVLAEKFDPTKWPQYSPKLLWLVGGILGQEPQLDFGWGPVRCKRIRISSGGLVIAGEPGNEVLAGLAAHFDRDLTALVREVGLTRVQLLEFGRLYRQVVTDHRSPKLRAENKALVR